MKLTERPNGPIVQAHGVFPTAEAADDALAAYLFQWHGAGARGKVSPTQAGYVVLCSRAAGVKQ